MPLTRQYRQIIPHRPIQPHIKRVADERVPDRHFVEVRQRAEERQVVEVEIVAGVDANAEAVREASRRPRIARSSPARSRPPGA